MTDTDCSEEVIRSLALSYFPDCRFVEDRCSLETLDDNIVFYGKKEILPYLQTMFFEEHLVEVQVDRGTRVFFSQLVDEPPNEDWEGDAGEVVVVELEHEPGSYLKAGDSFLLTPLTPGIGNAHARVSKYCIVRYFSGTTAIELGCTFRGQAMVEQTPALRFNFPAVGRVNRSFRSYRVKAGSAIDAKVRIDGAASPSDPRDLFQIYDVSVEGLAFELPDRHAGFTTGETVKFTIKVEGFKDLKVSGSIRNVNKVRDKKGYKTICGVQFDLETRALASELERVAATIQRLYLREIAEKTEGYEGIQIVR